MCWALYVESSDEEDEEDDKRPLVTARKMPHPNQAPHVLP
jgi:hypothetical protein